MKYGVHLPNFGAFGDARALAGLARDAETAGWDGFFLWDHLLFCEFDRNDHVDPWVALTAVAAATDRIMLGPLVTPLPRRRPWELARQAVSLQNYSGGRLILGVGLGEPVEWDFRFFGDETDAVVRGQMLDEGLAVLTGLWSGEAFGFSGTHYSLEPMTFLPAPHAPIPIWVGGSWPNGRPFRRAARFDGMVPMVDGTLSPSALQPAVDYVHAHRTDPAAPFDVVASGRSDADGQHPSEEFEGLATWWLEDISPLRFGWDWPDLANVWDVDALRDRILAGPRASPGGAQVAAGQQS
ncbi:LLM class flavin-dependent oxidoreductase [Mycetocola sp. 2940]|uniref:LLM class flavin-dependent oxidoreductase n=1 Tax=Mycetocola sp. 2940 TaxID=3156452 RepID=UPI003393478C